MADLNRRETHRQVIIGAVNYTSSEDFMNQPLIPLQTRRNALERSFERFLEEHLTIVEAVVEPTDMAPQHELMNQVNEHYFRALANFDARIQQLEREQNQVQEQVAPLGQQREQPRLSDFRLESIKLSNFDGSYANWNEWRALFDSLIHNQTRLSKTEKFHYMKKSLTGAAESVLSGWQLTGDNYDAAYESLVQRFDNQYRIIMAHLDTLNAIPRASSESYECLRRMTDTTNRVIRQLRVAGSPVQHWDHVVVYMLVSRMPPRTLQNWETSQNLDKMPTLDEVLKFIERRAGGMLNLTSQPSTSAQARAVENNNVRSNYGPRAEGQKSTISCYKCGKPHPIFKCDDLLKKPIAEREKIVRGLKLCRNCFQKTHEAGSQQCKAGKCRNCKKEFHNSILCPNTKTIAIIATKSAKTAAEEQDFH